MCVLIYFQKYNIAVKMDKCHKATWNKLYMIIYVHSLFAVLLLIKKTKQKGSKWFW